MTVAILVSLVRATASVLGRKSLAHFEVGGNYWVRSRFEVKVTSLVLESLRRLVAFEN